MGGGGGGGGGGWWGGGGGMVGREEMNGVGEIIIGEWIGEMGVKKTQTVSYLNVNRSNV